MRVQSFGEVDGLRSVEIAMRIRFTRPRGTAGEGTGQHERWENAVDGLAHDGDCSVDAHHCERKATIGSALAARRAGIYVASTVVAARLEATAAYVRGSIGRTPYSSDEITGVSSMAAAIPNAIPIKVTVSPWRRKSAQTLPGCAPSAMRIPIS